MNQGEERLIKFQFKFGGDFIEALFRLMGRADDDNLAKLALGFPEEVEAYNRFRTEDGYWQRLIAEFNKEHGTNLVD